MKARRPTRWKTTVRGIVCEHDGEGDDPPSRLAVVTPDEDEFFIVDDEAGRELEELLEEEVEVRCFVERGAEGQLYAEVLNVRVPAWELDDPDDDGDGLDWEDDEDTEDLDAPDRKRWAS